MRHMKLVIVLIVLAVLCTNEAKKKKRKLEKGMILRQKETNPIHFIRLTVMRLIYGFATRLGFGEQISEALNGVFVPPGVDYYDDYADGPLTIFNRDDDYDY